MSLGKKSERQKNKNSEIVHIAPTVVLGFNVPAFYGPPASGKGCILRHSSFSFNYFHPSIPNVKNTFLKKLARAASESVCVCCAWRQRRIGYLDDREPLRKARGVVEVVDEASGRGHQNVYARLVVYMGASKQKERKSAHVSTP